jgi:hypothetical protein
VVPSHTDHYIIPHQHQQNSYVPDYDYTTSINTLANAQASASVSASASHRPRPPGPKPGDLDPALSSDAHLYAFDARFKPTDVMATRLMSHRWSEGLPSIRHQRDPTQVVLVSRQFPWRIVLSRGIKVGHDPITVFDVWNELWHTLHKPLKDEDWGWVRMMGPAKWVEVEGAAKKRLRIEAGEMKKEEERRKLEPPKVWKRGDP